MLRYTEGTIVRFWAMLDRRGPNECWPWLGSTRGGGYGKLRPEGERTWIKADAMAYELAHGEIPSGQWVLHRCDVKPCCNPAHLFLGDNSANMRDAQAKGLLYRPITVGEMNAQARLTEADVRAVLMSRETNVALAKRLGVTHQQISNIRRRKAWAHVTIIGGDRLVTLVS